MVIRRHCDPINVKRVWDAIRSVNLAHQSSDLTRIHKYLQNKNNCTLQQVELYLKQCLSDGLIVSVKKSGYPDLNCTYRITDQELPNFDDKDWYCFECHLAGEVNLCANCFRVFHLDCIQSAKKKFAAHVSSITLQCDKSDKSLNSSNPSLNGSLNISSGNKSDLLASFDETLCNVCNIINVDDCKLEKAEMNYLLKFVLHRIRNWLPNTITHTMAAEDRPAWLTDSELTWRANQLFFEHRDMSVIEVNLNSESYSILSEFLADILTVQHNVAIFHGIESQEYQAADFMVRDTWHDIIELRNCSDCYRHSNEKGIAKWFALPCREPHTLVWAKQKGYPYWPAKVIKESSSHFDVRFFGGKHERAVIAKTFIKPISVSKESLKIKPSLAFTKALEELIYHQKLLANPQEVEKLLAESRLKKPAKKLLTSFMSVPTLAKSTDAQPAIPKVPESINMPSTTKRRSEISESSEPPLSKISRADSKSGSRSSGNVINISDCEDEGPDFPFRLNSMQAAPGTFEENYEQVSSSTENYRRVTEEPDMHELDQPYSDSVEKMRWKAEMLTDKNEIIKCAMECMQAEIDRLTEERNEHLKKLFESHNAQISETKKKQWCYNCEQDAIYHCCWNTAYCSQTCQQQHWQAEHKKVCRRKRQT